MRTLRQTCVAAAVISQLAGNVFASSSEDAYDLETRQLKPAVLAKVQGWLDRKGDPNEHPVPVFSRADDGKFKPSGTIPLGSIKFVSSEGYHSADEVPFNPRKYAVVAAEGEYVSVLLDPIDGEKTAWIRKSEGKLSLVSDPGFKLEYCVDLRFRGTQSRKLYSKPDAAASAWALSLNDLCVYKDGKKLECVGERIQDKGYAVFSITEVSGNFARLAASEGDAYVERVNSQEKTPKEPVKKPVGWIRIRDDDGALTFWSICPYAGC